MSSMFSNGLMQSYMGHGGGGGGGDFPNPFLDVASTAVPRSLRNALYWCEYIYSFMGTYRMAMERIISYFLTDIEFGDASDEVKDKYTSFYGETLDFFTVLQNLLRDRMCYGNGFASYVVPFKRWLGCPQCGSSWPLKEVYAAKSTFNFEFADMEFTGSCPVCVSQSGPYRGKLNVIDRADDHERRLSIKHWSPHEIELLHDPYSHDVAYLWRIPEDYKDMIRKGNLFHLERVPRSVLEAIKHNFVFRFNQDALFHMKEPTLAGIRNRGWGLPRILTNFRQIYYVQVLRRMNEAIGLDYVIPLRVITPEARPGAASGSAGDPLMMLNGSDASAQIRGMLRRRRRDPAGWAVLPFPVKYSLLGGEANQLAPRDLLDQAYEVLLNDSGTPVELYKGSLQLQAAPVALRLFESTWHHLVHDSNAFLRWSLRQTSRVLNWEEVTASLKRVTIADDIQKQMALLQLMMGQQISGTTGLKVFDINWKEEQRLKAEETQTQSELQARTQEEMSQQAFAAQIAKGQPGGASGGAAAGGAAGGAAAGGQPQGGDPSQGGMAGPVTSYLQSGGHQADRDPESMYAQADSLAQQLLGLPEATKDSELRLLKQGDPPMHSLVKAQMDGYREKARTQGGAQVMQQSFGGQQAAA